MHIPVARSQKLLPTSLMPCLAQIWRGAANSLRVFVLEFFVISAGSCRRLPVGIAGPLT